MNFEQVRAWVAAHPVQPIHVDCATAVMLKILDGKCKMKAAEKQVMELLYDAVKSLPGEVLESSLHGLVESARENADDAMKMRIYEQRLLAETTISRPVMKGFKAWIRQNGLLDDIEDHEADS
ncbi:MAG: hypothetical protein PHH11_06185 [Methylomonas sp.]|nr:hypothetical protein [Methylomonas sp.]